MKSLSGKYIDKQGFTYNVFRERKNVWTWTLYNSEGKYCSHSTYTKEEMIQQISGFVKISK